jgi:6-phosphogluconolactonase/glucosamine-6-phosphate isomerase/deaminase
VQIDLDIDNSDAAQQSARTKQQASTKTNFKIILPGGTTPNITFAGFVKKFSMQTGVDQVVRGQIIIRITGGYTLA